jgi:hypothetical protein
VLSHIACLCLVLWSNNYIQYEKHALAVRTDTHRLRCLRGSSNLCRYMLMIHDNLISAPCISKLCVWCGLCWELIHKETCRFISHKSSVIVENHLRTCKGNVKWIYCKRPVIICWSHATSAGAKSNLSTDIWMSYRPSM